MLPRVTFFLCLSAAFGIAAASHADTTTEVGDHVFFDELPVVLSVSRLAQPLADAPGSVTVIDAAAIRSSGARDLADLLRTVPGFLVAQNTGGAPIAVYHGMTDENPRGLQILVDGRSQYSPLFFGGVSWNLIDVSLDDIERIEVIRGSNSAAFGSNAFLGVVNVVTRAAAGAQGGGVRIAQGNDGVEDRYARLGIGIGNAFVRLSAEGRHDKGVVDFNDSRRNDRMSLRADLPLGVADEIQFLAGMVELDLNAGEPGNRRLPPRPIHATKDYFSAAWMHNAIDGGSVSLRYSRSRERYRDYFVAGNAGLDALAAGLGLQSPYPVVVDQRIRTVRDEFEFQHTVVPTENLRWVWGFGERHDRVQAKQFYGTHDTLEQAVHRVFGNVEWRPASWVVNLGATREDDSLSDVSLAPRLSVNYHLNPEQTVRWAASRAHRNPTLTESLAQTAYGSFDTGLLPGPPPYGVIPVEVTRRASGNLKQEKIDVQEIGYLGDFRARHLFADLRVFRERVRDRIVPVELALTAPDCDLLGLFAGGCGRATDYLNGQELDIRGLEYQLRWRPRVSTELTLNQAFISIEAHANEAFYRRDPVAAEAADRHMENSAPKVATMLRWSERLPLGLEGSIVHYRYSRFQWTVDSSVGPSKRTDFRLAYPLRLLGSAGELALVVQGLGGHRAEYRDRAAGTTAVRPEFLRPRGWLSLTVGL